MTNHAQNYAKTSLARMTAKANARNAAFDNAVRKTLDAQNAANTAARIAADVAAAAAAKNAAQWMCLPKFLKTETPQTLSVTLTASPEGYTVTAKVGDGIVATTSSLISPEDALREMFGNA